MSKIKSKQYFCIFGGGAIRGLAYLGAMQAMEEVGITIKAYGGSSVGAIFAAFAALNYSYDEFKELFNEVNFDLFRDLHFGITKNFAISKGEHFQNWIRTGIEKKYYGVNYKKGENAPVRFKDIDKDFFIITSNLNGCTPYVFSKYTTPDFEVAQAVKISSSLPGLLDPFVLDENVLVDGDLMKSWPMWKTQDLLCPEDSRVIEFRLEGAKCWPDVKNTVGYMNAVFATLSNFATDYISSSYQDKDKFDYIKIDTQHILPVQFALPQKDREDLIKLGYDTTIKYFKEDLVQKKKRLLPYYTVLLDNLIKIKNSLISNNINSAKLDLADLFIHLCEAKEFVDSSLYTEILSFKNDFYSNLTESFLFKKLGLKNKKQIESCLFELYDDVLERCMELKSYIQEFE